MAPCTPVRRGPGGGAPTDSPLALLSSNMAAARLDALPAHRGGKGAAASGLGARGGASTLRQHMPASAAAAREETLPPPGAHLALDLTKDWEADGSAKPRKSAHSQSRGDRFIPNRELSRSQGGSHDSLLDNTGGETLHSAHASSSASSTCDDVSLSQSIAAANQIPTDVAGAGAELPSFDDGGVPQQRILSFSAAAPPSLSQPDVRARYAATRAKAALPSSLLAGGRRKIQTHAIKTLDAVAVAPDFYRNTLHWSSRNVLAVSLAECVHLWNGDTGEVEMLLDLQEQSERFGGGAHGAITSLRWNGDGQSLAVGTASGHMQIWDAASKQRLRTLRPSAEGGADCVDVNACAWGDEGMLSLGFASGLIREHDVRVRESVVRELPNAHAGAVCGLAWRRDGVLLASGGNDNVVQVWDRRSDAPRLRKNVHSAAVKALAWCPWNDSILATGGGSADRNIHFWNVTAGSRTQSIKTDHQVVGLHWSEQHREIASIHGEAVGAAYERAGAISVWAHPAGSNIATIEAPHDGRVIRNSALSPDGQTVATIGDDESLRMWALFEVSEEDAKSAKRRGAPGSGDGAGRLAHASRGLR